MIELLLSLERGGFFMLFWGLLPSAGATFRSSLFARPFVALLLGLA